MGVLHVWFANNEVVNVITKPTWNTSLTRGFDFIVCACFQGRGQWVQVGIRNMKKIELDNHGRTMMTFNVEGPKGRTKAP